MDNQNGRTLDLDDLDIQADEALERALMLPPGIERQDALKLASRLRYAADLRKPLQVKRGRPKKAYPAGISASSSLRTRSSTIP
jgi:hypothetical protein